jgi:primosomal protein N' (replication factor Y) (superfamily II helicase)
MSLPRARVVTLNAALGPLDYRVPDGMQPEEESAVLDLDSHRKKRGK